MAPNPNAHSSSHVDDVPPPPADLVDSLARRSPHDALLSIARTSEIEASRLASELTSSLLQSSSVSSGVGGGGGGHVATAASAPGARGRTLTNIVPLPRSLRDAPRLRIAPHPSEKGEEGGASEEDSTRASSSLRGLDPSHPLTHATIAAESILSSLSKIASGG